jgi:hypothetical protein
MQTHAYQPLMSGYEAAEGKRRRFTRICGAVPGWTEGAHLRVSLTGGDHLKRCSCCVSHHLVGQGEALKIKRIDVIQSDAPFGNLRLFI